MSHDSVGSPDVLVVDLDGTLIRSDMLLETFWSACAANWKTPILAAGSLTRGRAALKQRLADAGPCDIATLPYNDEVLDYVRRWRERGGRTALVTASHQALAERIAAHVGLFDEVHGSDGTTNLKGPNKAAFLERHFGARGFAYIGDSKADLPVWEKSSRAVTVNVSRAFRGRAEALGVNVEHITSHPRSVAPYFKALRPHQWLKNVLVFLPMLMAHQLTAETILRSLLAFIAFSLVASSVYVLNDLLDLASDRAHPRKRNRPFASGSVPIGHGFWLVLLLLSAGLAVSISLGGAFLLVMLGYFAATLAYSLHLKRRMIVDICTLAGLYTVRLVAGGVATGVPLSMWLLAFSTFFFLALAAVKRQAELLDGIASGKVTAHGRGYHVDDVPLVATMATSAGYVSVLVMALYLNSPAVLELYSSPYLLWGVCLVLLYWISRMVMVTHRGNMHDDPVVFAVKDRVSQVCLLLVAGLVIAGAII